jgi:hypothetical protein
MINYSSKYIDEIFLYVINSEKIIAKPNQPNELTVSHLHSFIGWRGGVRGYIKGLGAMSAEERMAASAKGYENGLGAMSAEERMAKMGIAWEEKYAEFVSYDGMPKKGTPLYTWQENQLGNRSFSLFSKIREEIAENKGSTVWSKRRVKLFDCIEQKNRAKMDNAWEEKYAEFVSYDGMPKIGTPLHNWQNNELSKGSGSLFSKIREEIAENKGSTVWSKRRVKLFDCVEQKNHTKIGNAWEEKYAEFESYDGMPKIGTPLHTWQRNQLRKGSGSLNSKIQKEHAEKKGRTVWSERNVKLANCVAQKKRE